MLSAGRCFFRPKPKHAQRLLTREIQKSLVCYLLFGIYVLPLWGPGSFDSSPPGKRWACAQDDVGDALVNNCTKAKAPKRHAERRAVLFPPEVEACPKAANEGNTEIPCLLLVIWNL